jgi:hypothetical protein
LLQQRCSIPAEVIVQAEADQVALEADGFRYAAAVFDTQQCAKLILS